jgi:1,4-alpha-glucan branching enzyme
MYTQPGKKLLFMGSEFGQWQEWNHDASLDWHLCQYPPHVGLQRWVEDLNRLYRSEPALYELDTHPSGFEWIDCNDALVSVVSCLRKGHLTDDLILVVCNFTPVPRLNYRVGAPRGGFWQEVRNSDAHDYGGAGYGNMGGVEAAPIPYHGRTYSLNLTLPPLSVVFFKHGESGA